MKKLYEDYKDIWLCWNETGRLKNITTTVERHLKEQEYFIDRDNNIFLGDFSKKRPCLVAHLDSVHEYPSLKIRSNKKKGIIYSDNGIGGDDKCGIVAILEILSRNDNVNAIFTSDEEVGGVGATHLDTRILENVMYFIEIDRAGSSDVIFTSGGNQICSKEMQEGFANILTKYKFEEARGCFTDVNILTRRTGKSAINISAGYHNAHMEDEYVVLSQLQHTINCVEELVNNVREVFVWKEKRYSNKKSSGKLYTYNTNGASGRIPCDCCGHKKKTKSVLVEGSLFYLCKKCRKAIKRKEIVLTKQKENEEWEDYWDTDEQVNEDVMTECSHCGDWVPDNTLKTIHDAWGETKVCGICHEYFVAEYVDF